ncbi:uncharacterized protein LOC110006821 [Amborella trichopoda]|uniref:uncharacterized protein LOC110006821 n=1 Tax=Amborella trichopoda TaxID=13333 RepID=UPI0009BCA083|nr:uncharacterized protein LOC110006821 [Amborella trichopoda]|eukprot:XP_020519864.1 uncharacterized protein LOC110006821 [Amborella trichopoda]
MAENHMNLTMITFFCCFRRYIHETVVKNVKKTPMRGIRQSACLAAKSKAQVGVVISENPAETVLLRSDDDSPGPAEFQSFARVKECSKSHEDSWNVHGLGNTRRKKDVAFLLRKERPLQKTKLASPETLMLLQGIPDTGQLQVCSAMVAPSTLVKLTVSSSSNMSLNHSEYQSKK